MNLLKLKKQISILLVLLLVFSLSQAQNKDVSKGNELVKKAMETTDAAKRNETIIKATDAFKKGGMGKEMNVIIADAFLEKKDYTNAQSYYSRADKEAKMEGMKKMAESYVDDAFAEENIKNEGKLVAKAMNFYAKAGVQKDGARAIGDRYYDRGIDSYSKALDFYLQGDAAVKIEEIAKEYEGKGEKFLPKAAEVYKMLKTEAGYKKAGDIYFKQGDYVKSSEAYLTGNVADGIKKYADYLYSIDRFNDGDELYVKLAKTYSEKGDDDQVEKLARECELGGNYGLAYRIYDKVGNTPKATKSLAYDKIMNLQIDSAKLLLSSIQDAATIKIIDNNIKVLTAIKKTSDDFDYMASSQPFFSMIEDSVTGKSRPSDSDQRMLDEFYKSIKDQVYDKTVAVSANLLKITDPTLKKLLMQKFLHYPAVRNLVNPDTFAIKIQKGQFRAKDAHLK